MIRRLKKDVLKELPDKIRTKFILSDLNQVAFNEVQRIKAELSELDKLEVNPEDMAKLDNSMRLTIMEYYRQTALAKQESVCDYVKENIFNQIQFEITNNVSDNVSKFIIFAHHKAMMDAIQDRIKQECKDSNIKVDFMRIDGSVPSEERMELVNKFQNNIGVRIALLSITAACTGLTLTKAQTVIFAE